MRRLYNYEGNHIKEDQGARDLDLYRCICITSQTTIDEVLQYLQRWICSQAKWLQSRMDQEAPTVTPSNFITTKENQENQECESSSSSLDSVKLANPVVVYRTQRGHDAEYMLEREYAILLMGAMLRIKGWAPSPGQIYLFLVGTQSERSSSDNSYKLED
ncbi:MAG: hypothetical protein EZS28_035030 [Streblomastix strix]|uniref:Uncharacterized protein n=1 Tax=Streblomastix strix TaxID=222440 RepID=A0A5J4UGT9_9EUKA|nr:MAG: hypothetical protein EZS28_035030 [Streblomastix strix]